MIVKPDFTEWTPRGVFAGVGFALMMSFFFYAWLNIGGGPAQEIVGTVRALGMDTGIKRSLPRLVATVETETGESVAIELPTEAIVSVGSRVLIQKTPRTLSGIEYTYLRTAK